ncbi:DUF378 domain-containing protein [Candidatus Kaiserbacteria bacterium CG10_big_fil_rev_8_21_14_0_10_45_20]|uniref:DUF378 domain-containing protein n=1 Tax=Candidatus Kaiserbacteria bacterium CG10_big_fil_rev_8_21_14_0_10_45_20 TaxID=1974607 RepID=A0A2H0UIH5_9BACT|nr:MAG: DUF378 domain-containing protein [Candidatus Kaiserbacteria bacterium CG10_big_fil_rev_8_21_14_0_10_45_20]
MKYLHIIAFIFLVVGGLNWGVFAIFNWEIGSLFGGMDAMISKVIYILVGLSAVYFAVTHKKACKDCVAKPAGPAEQVM